MDDIRNSLWNYTRYMFRAVRGFDFVENWHHRAICDALTRVFLGETKRLIINIPPRYSKTELAITNFVSWAMGHCPDAEFIHASYSALLASNNAYNVRAMIQHEAYAALFSDVTLKYDSKAKNHWKTEDGGVMYAAGSDGTITGFGAGKLRDGFGGAFLIDDPHKAQEARRSDAKRKAIIQWFQGTVESRLNTPETPIIVIMQRLHEDDLTGWLLDGGNGEEWEHLCIPAIQPDGSALWPWKHDIHELRRLEKTKPFDFSGQYQQSPVPDGGGMFKVDWLQHRYEFI